VFNRQLKSATINPYQQNCEILSNADDNYILSGKHLRKKLFNVPFLLSEGWEGALLDTHTAKLLACECRRGCCKGSLVYKCYKENGARNTSRWWV